MDDDNKATLAEIEEAQPALRQSIEAAKLLTEEADCLIKHSRQELSEEGSGLD